MGSVHTPLLCKIADAYCNTKQESEGEFSGFFERGFSFFLSPSKGYFPKKNSKNPMAAVIKPRTVPIKFIHSLTLGKTLFF